MIRKYLRTKDVSLPTDVEITFDYKTDIARVVVRSAKCYKDTNFEKPYKYGISM